MKVVIIGYLKLLKSEALNIKSYRMKQKSF